MQPIHGAQKEGGLGFVKGVGKGLIGVVARPVSGVVDFASSSINAVKQFCLACIRNKWYVFYLQYR